MDSALKQTAKIVLITSGLTSGLYLGILGLLIVFPSLQAYAVYLHKVTLTYSKDLNVPEQFGFLHNQVVPFHIVTEDGIKLHAWQILPFTVYQNNEKDLLAQDLEGPVDNITKTINFRLLRDDPDARLVLYMHGTSGTIGSTIRPDSYRNIYSAAPDKIHVLSFDYRGYGLSDGQPSERGLLLDALAVVQWATSVAGVSPDRIVIYGQSMGSAVSVSLLNYLAAQKSPVSFAGMVISASFSDLGTLTATYRIGGLIPVLSPIAKFPPLFRFFVKRLRDKWLVKDELAAFVRQGKQYYITLIHSEDDTDIPCLHTQNLFWHAVNASSTTQISYEDLEKEKNRRKTDLGPGGWFVDWKTSNGLIRQEMLKYGLHDKQMTYPVTALAILRAFQSKHPNFAS